MQSEIAIINICILADLSKYWIWIDEDVEENKHRCSPSVVIERSFKHHSHPFTNSSRHTWSSPALRSKVPFQDVIESRLWGKFPAEWMASKFIFHNKLNLLPLLSFPFLLVLVSLFLKHLYHLEMLDVEVEDQQYLFIWLFIIPADDSCFSKYFNQKATPFLLSLGNMWVKFLLSHIHRIAWSLLFW